MYIGMIERLNSSLFDWLTWRNGTILDLLGIHQRKHNLIANRHTIRKHAVGWAKAENIPCRPKANCIAVMFVVRDIKFWTHLTREEFDCIFKEEKDGTIYD